VHSELSTLQKGSVGAKVTGNQTNKFFKAGAHVGANKNAYGAGAAGTAAGAATGAGVMGLKQKY
jgi:hypothetical protein